MKIRAKRTELFHADRRTYKWTEEPTDMRTLTVAFRNFANAPKNARNDILHLIFIGPCMVIYSYSTTNRLYLLSGIIYSCKTLCMFRTVLPSISSPTAAGSSSSLTYIVAVYAVLSSWWWTEGTFETCRLFYNNKEFK